MLGQWRLSVIQVVEDLALGEVRLLGLQMGVVFSQGRWEALSSFLL